MADILRSITTPEFLINLVVKASFILALAGALTAVLRRSSAALRHWIWCLTFTTISLLPVVSLVLSSQHLTVLPYSWGENTDPLTVGKTKFPGSEAESGSGLVVSGLKASAQADISGGPASAANWTVSELLACIWLAGLCFLILKRVLEIGSIYWTCMRDRNRVVEGWETDLNYIKHQMEMHRPVRLVFSQDATVPFTLGIFKPFIVLPLAARTWSAEQRQTVLLHELAHIRRFDYVANLLAEIVRAVHWYHPLVWFAVRQSQVEREHATDDFVLNHGTENITYAEKLLEITRQLQPKSLLRRGVVAMASSNSIKKRMEHILAPEIPRQSLGLKSAFFWLITLCLCGLAVASVQLRPKAHVESPTVTAEVVGKSVDELLMMLEEDNRVSIKIAALHELGRRGERKTFYPVVKLLRDSNAEIRTATLQALYGIGCDPAFVAITVSLRDPNPVVRQKAAVLLGQLNDKPMTKPVQRVLSDYGRWAPPYLRNILGEFEDLTALEYLIRTLSDPVPSVRIAATKALQRIDHAKSTTSLSSLRGAQNFSTKI